MNQKKKKKILFNNEMLYLKKKQFSCFSQLLVKFALKVKIENYEKFS